ncbi:MAG: energy transducer TonB [Ferruginibacter sp.]
MDPEKTHIIYTGQDIRDYLSGKLSPAERHAMESAALDDAFLAEAMEGYESMQEENLEKTLAMLRGNFSNTTAAKIVPLKAASSYRLLKLVAVILFILGSVALTYMLTRPSHSNQSLAVVTSKKDTIDKPIETLPPNSLPAETTTTTAGKTVSAAKKTSTPANENATVQQAYDSTFIYRPSKSAKNQELPVTGGGYVDNVTNDSKNITSNNEAPSNQNNVEPLAIQKNKISEAIKEKELSRSTASISNRRFSAQVIGQDGSPLPFANISIANENFGTYADAKGMFGLVSPDSLLQVEVKSAGYISRNIILRSDIGQNKIVLAEDELALSDKTIVSGKLNAANKNRKAVLVPDTVINVEPADGWANYDTYITNNLSVSNEIVSKKIHGEVEVSFDVQRNGAIANIKIDKSLCADCDEAAMRAIKDGPRWKIKKGGKSSGKVKVKF